VLEADDTWIHSTEGPAPVGVYEADESLDGVFDLAGNLEEWVRDSHLALTHECWDQPQLVDPVCFEPGVLPRVRGGAWGGPAGGTSAGIRRESVDDIRPGVARGFRCVRPASEPDP
jgi:formylglycine-generating enzyme required for sulfatase activity